MSGAAAALRARVGLLAALLALAGCAALPGAPGQSTARSFVLPVARPELRVGDQWVYAGRESGPAASDARKLIARTVTSVAGDQASLRQVALDPDSGKPSGPARTRAVKLASWHLEPAARWSGEIRSLVFPLTPGKHWRYEYWLAGQGDVVTTYRFEARVDGVETIRTPAGRFETLRVTHSGSWSRSVLEDGKPALQQGAITTTYWYAPAIGTWARLEVESRRPDGGRDFGVVQELEAFRRGK